MDIDNLINQLIKLAHARIDMIVAIDEDYLRFSREIDLLRNILSDIDSLKRAQGAAKRAEQALSLGDDNV